MNTETIKAQLRELRMHTAPAELEALLAEQRKTVALDWVASLLAREVDARKQRAVVYRIKRAEFPEVTSLEGFDWDFNPGIDRAAIEKLATLDFIDKHEIALFLGKPGTGKNHLALAIARHAITEHQSSAVFTTALKIAREYKSTWSKGSAKTEDDVIRYFTRPDLLIIDEVGVQFGSDAEKLIMFEIINTRYERMKPTILISNQTREELAAFIGERVLDRMSDGGGCTLSFTWDSYRSKGAA